MVSLVGWDIDGWLEEAFRRFPAPAARALPGPPAHSERGQSTLSQFYKKAACPVCTAPTLFASPDPPLTPLPSRLGICRRGGACSGCEASGPAWLVTWGRRGAEAESRLRRLELLCSACARVPGGVGVPCVALPCPVLHAKADLAGSLAKQRAALAALRLSPMTI